MPGVDLGRSVDTRLPQSSPAATRSPTLSRICDGPNDMLFAVAPLGNGFCVPRDAAVAFIGPVVGASVPDAAVDPADGGGFSIIVCWCVGVCARTGAATN